MTKFEGLYNDNDRALAQWEQQADEDHYWAHWTIKRLRTALQDTSRRPVLDVTSSGINGEGDGIEETEMDVLVRLPLTLPDRIYHYCRGMFFSMILCGEAPIWMSKHEWFWLCSARDLRYHSETEGALLLKGTGMMGFCQFDVERAAQKFLSSKGLSVEACYVENDLT